MRASEAARSLRADVLFMSTTAVTDGHCYHQSQETVAVKRALMESADRRVLLLDHSKFSKNGLHRLAALSAFDLIVVDPATPEVIIGSLRVQGLPVRVAGCDDMDTALATASASAGHSMAGGALGG